MRFWISLLMLAVIALPAGSADVRAKVRDATDGFKDIRLTCKVLQANQKELKKIGKDFPKSYEFKSSKVLFKAPDKMKMEGKLGVVKVRMVINGDQKAIVVPAVHYSDKENIAGEPHKRQTELDIGIVTESLWKDYRVIDTDEEKGSDGPIYRITYVRTNATDKKQVAWIDARTLKLLKVDKYESDGKLESRYLYMKHQKVGCIWVPTRIEVYNCDNKLAGVTAYEDIKVNTGIPDSEFRL
ncbi:MAG: outer membrane lipoprotein-sorting protein [Armatimonadota bacterium]